ncbi:MAG: hypothetical protein LBN21_02465 [Treponema sp.]|jgi:hypothetical protein|nr:hypothetical protein [Treponema sp.]
MKKFSIMLALFSVLFPAAADQPLFAWDLLWSGSWEAEKTLSNRGDLHLRFPVPGLVLRAQAADKRPARAEAFLFTVPKAEDFNGFGGGLYHSPTGSRLLYGVLDEWGLTARVRNPWIRGLPFAENHQPLMADLKTESSSTKMPEAYLYLGSPQFGIFSGFASARFTPLALETNPNPGFGLGIEAQLGNKTRLHLEGLYSERVLPPRKSSAWFSETPPLPERESRLGALALLFTTPGFALSSDWACSETFAWGRDIYGNLGFRFNGTLPAAKNMAASRWTASFAADGAGNRYIGSDGSSPGAGFRSAGKFEWQGPRSSLARFNTSLRAPAIGKDFDRSSTTLYYRFPLRPAGSKTGPGDTAFPLRITRVSLTADRNAVNRDKIIDGLDAKMGLSLHLPFLNVPLGLSLSGSADWLSQWETGAAAPFPYPFTQYPQTFNSAKASGELSWSPGGKLFNIPGSLQLKGKLGYTAAAKKDPQWDTSFSAAVRIKQGRLSVKIASPEFPEKWDYTISWRIEKK